MLEAAEKKNIILLALAWLYLDAPKDILKAWRNFLLFNLNFFSIPALLRTFFSPWRRYSHSHLKGFDIKGYLESLGFNLFSRFLGALMRTVLILFGLAIEAAIIVFGLLLLLGWLALPLFSLYLLWYGISLWNLI